MLDGAAGYVREQLRKRRELIPVGMTWTSMFLTDVLVLLGGVLATAQRPAADLPVALAAFAILLVPPALFFVFSVKLGPALLWATWSLAAAVMLFATSTPIHADFAPALLVLMVGAVGTLTNALGGF